MNKMLKLMFATSMLIIISIPIAQASVVTYNIAGVFHEPQTQPLDTVFNGSFDWDGATVSNLHGTMNSSMYDTDDVTPDFSGSFPLIYLNNQLAQSIEGNIVTATVFNVNTTDVFFDGGYVAGDTVRYGGTFFGNNDGNQPNENAYFSFAFDKTTMAGVLDEMVYADCTAGGMMGQFCMTGHSIAKVGFAGTMAAVPASLTISAVPVPAAVWLFGSALLGMIGVSRKRTLSV